MIRPAELIERKRNGEEHAPDDLAELVLAYARDEVPDYQMAAWCMAVYFNGLSGHLVPADKKLYALRDVTATVDIVPLIASSIMSKKLAAGADAIVLDVKVGDGAFMKTLAEARVLAMEMIELGQRAGKEVTCLLTDMDQPLGR